MTQPPGGDATLAEALEWLLARVEDGVKCPCCDQMAKVYRRKISSGIVRVLIEHWLAVGMGWGQTAQISSVSREGAKLAYWGLMEADGRLREDGGHSGNWRITETGRSFLMGDTTVHKYAHVYDSSVLRLSGPQVTIQEALGSRFNYAELMAGV